MNETRDAWGQVGDHLSALLLKLKLHAEEEISEADVTAKEGVDKLCAVFRETVDAIADAAKDEAVREDAKEAGRAFVEAMDATSRDVQERFRSST